MMYVYVCRYYIYALCLWYSSGDDSLLQAGVEDWWRRKSIWKGKLSELHKSHEFLDSGGHASSSRHMEMSLFESHDSVWERSGVRGCYIASLYNLHCLHNNTHTLFFDYGKISNLKIKTRRYDTNLLNNCQTAVEPDGHKLTLIGRKKIKYTARLMSYESICAAMAHDNLYDDDQPSWMTTWQLLHSEMMHSDVSNKSRSEGLCISGIMAVVSYLN